MSVPKQHRGWTAPSATGTIEEGPARALCTFCKGTGRHTVFERFHSDGRIAERKFQICERCGGRGWVLDDSDVWHGGGYVPKDAIGIGHGSSYGKITFGSLEMPLKHPMSIGYGVTVGGPDDPDPDLVVHQEVDFHGNGRWERHDDDWEGVSAAAKRQILSARRRRALKGNLREIS